MFRKNDRPNGDVFTAMKCERGCSMMFESYTNEELFNETCASTDLNAYTPVVVKDQITFCGECRFRNHATGECKLPLKQVDGRSPKVLPDDLCKYGCRDYIKSGHTSCAVDIPNGTNFTYVDGEVIVSKKSKVRVGEHLYTYVLFSECNGVTMSHEIKSITFVGGEFRYYYGTQDNMYFTDSAIDAGLVYTTDTEARCRLSERIKK